jgi:anti-sigma B factor antagonist
MVADESPTDELGQPTIKEVDTVEDVFAIDQHERNGVPVLTVRGEIDLATAPALRSAIQSELAAGRSRITVDLLGVTFLDSTALGVLVGGMKQCQAAGGDLDLVISEPRIIKIFEITGLTDVFSISPSLDGDESASTS